MKALLQQNERHIAYNCNKMQDDLGPQNGTYPHYWRVIHIPTGVLGGYLLPNTLYIVAELQQNERPHFI